MGVLGQAAKWRHLSISGGHDAGALANGAPCCGIQPLAMND
jgi:hypothetical protein